MSSSQTSQHESQSPEIPLPEAYREASWLPRLRDSMARAPDPESAAQWAAKLLTTPLPGSRDLLCSRLEANDAERSEKLARILLATCGIAPFLASHLRRHPEWLPALLDETLAEPRDAELLAARARERLGGLEAEAATAALREFKYYELIRLTARDCCEDWVPLARSGVTLREISQLADVLLTAALGLARSAVESQHGMPRWLDGEGKTHELDLCVLALGKLGSSELNYSSDVDLVYLYSSPPESVDPTRLLQHPRKGSALSPPEYFTRLAQSFGHLVAGVTPAGFLYRIDLELRPEGNQGPIVSSEEALVHYYEGGAAATWEKAAFMKARPVAGDLSLGWRTIRRLDPVIYRSTMDYAAVEGIRKLKRSIERVHGSRPEGFNVKIDAGGIRDIEFIAQGLQLLHGARIPQIRERSTQRALRRLGEVGLLTSEQSRSLLAAYHFLRRLENRIQMEGERQAHRVPREEPARTRLARSLGLLSAAAGERLEAGIQAQRERVLAFSLGSLSEEKRDRILELFMRNQPALAADSGNRSLLETLADRFARAVAASPDPERCINNLDRFIASIGSRRFYYELLFDRPELVERLAGLFGASRFLSNYFINHPRLIEPLFADPDLLLLTREQLVAGLEATRADFDLALEGALATLRVFQHQQIVNVGLLDVAGKIERSEVEASLSEIAEVCIEAALPLARQLIADSREPMPENLAEVDFLIIGMGKLGSRELSYGSDLDLIFIYALPPEDQGSAPLAQHHLVRLTQRLISILQTPTREGRCYEIDARLRPSGNQGSLVTSLDGFRRYHQSAAAIWERQALLRARPVAGSATLARAFEVARMEILESPPPVAAPRGEIHDIRRRMEIELAREIGGHRNLKTGRGGMLDVETVVQFLQLAHGGEHPELLRPDGIDAQLGRLLAYELLAERDAGVLVAGWAFLQRLSSRLRIVENRSISDFDETQGTLESLAGQMGYPASAGGGRKSFLRDYREHTDAIRGVYDRILKGSEPGG